MLKESSCHLFIRSLVVFPLKSMGDSFLMLDFPKYESTGFSTAASDLHRETDLEFTAENS